MTAVLEPDLVLEKAPLERYVPPAKPSLVGLTRAALAEALGAIGVAPSQQKMRVQQLWHWMYVRGAQDFSQMTSVSKELHAVLDAHYTLARPEVVALAKTMRQRLHRGYAMSFRDISAELFALGHTSKSGKPFTASSVRKMLV